MARKTVAMANRAADRILNLMHRHRLALDNMRLRAEVDGTPMREDAMETAEAWFKVEAAIYALARRAVRRRRRAASTRYITAQRGVWARYTPEERAERVAKMRGRRA